MTVSEFDTLRSDILAMRGEFTAVRAEIGDLDARLAAMRGEIDVRFVRIEAKLDEKPGVAMLYQVALGAPIALVGFTAAIATLANAVGLI